MEFYRTTKHGYRFDKRIFWSVLGVLGLIAAIVLLQVHSLKNTYYWTCPEDTRGVCLNPFTTAYNGKEFGGCTIPDTAICTTPMLQPGQSVGTPPPFLVENFTEIAFFVVLAGFLINHFASNWSLR